jgi:hypothetical protein
MIDWATKRGMNAYFLQFFDSYPFWRRWNQHEHNPELSPEGHTEADARGGYETALDAIEKRDLVAHGVGHGWTARALGLPARGWEESDAAIPETDRQLIAKKDGERSLHDGTPADTELCYSNPTARRRIIDAVVEYVESHSRIDVIHLWLSDGRNNHCECEECRNWRPADLYVTLLNELAAALDERNLEVRVAFLVYLDLLWGPLERTIDEPDRFHLMFAPIARSYGESYRDIDMTDLPTAPEYERNELSFPGDLETNLALLSEWEDAYSGDAFSFEYHLWRDHYYDPGTIETTETVAADMAALDRIGMNGNLSCQVQRLGLPTALPMVAMTERLWDRDRSIEDLKETHLSAAFGRDADTVESYLNTLSGRFDPGLLDPQDRHRPNGTKKATVLEDLSSIPRMTTKFRTEIDRRSRQSSGSRRVGWENLRHHSQVIDHLANALAADIRNESAKARRSWREAKQYVRQHELDMHYALDVWCFINVFDWRFDDE